MMLGFMIREGDSCFFPHAGFNIFVDGQSLPEFFFLAREITYNSKVAG